MAFNFFPSPTPIFPILAPLAWSVHKKPIMASRTTTAATGRGTQFACAAYPRWAFQLSYGGNSWLRDQTQNIVVDATQGGLTELELISGLYLACRGSFGEFYYSDPDDFSRLNQPVGTGNGTQTTFQLFYTWGTGPFTPALTIPVTGIQAINAVYFNGIVQSTSSYGVDPTNTQLVFASPPANGVVITADFEFYFRCRFLDDNMKFEQWASNLWDLKEVNFESVKP